MKRLGSVALLLPMLLGGCASTGFPGARPLTYATPGAARVYATSDKCVHEANDVEAAGLVAAALTGVASQLLKNFGTALTEGAKGGALPSSVATQNLQVDPGKTPKCVVVIRGAFAPTAKATKNIDLPSYLGLREDATDQRQRLTDLDLPPLYRIDHYLELRLGVSNNSKALTFSPVFFKLGQSIDGSTKGERDFSVALKINRVGADPVGSAVLIADSRIGSSKTWEPHKGRGYEIQAPWFGTFHAPPPVAGAASTGAAPVAPAPAPSSASPGPTTPAVVGGGGGGSGGGGAVGGAGSSRPSMHSTKPDAVPATVTVTVVETRPTNEGLAFIATVFSGLQPKIEAAIKPVLDSEARQAADDAEATAALGAQVEFSTADGAARGALISYCKLASVALDTAGGQDRITKSTAARTAQLKANVSAIKAEVQQPFGSLVVVSEGLPGTVNATPCSGV